MKKTTIIIYDDSEKILKALKVDNLTKLINEMIRGEAWITRKYDDKGNVKYELQKWNII